MKKQILFILFICASFLGISQEDNRRKDSTKIIFSYTTGVYKKTLDLELNTVGEKGTLFYTLDGSKPSKKSKKYLKKITISSSKTIRVIGYFGTKKSKIYTRNYVISDRKFTLPIVFISMNPSDLFDEERGIYAKGLNAEEEPPHRGANYHKNWERRTNIEYLETTGKTGFNQIAGIKIAGKYSTVLPQKSFAIIARKKYGKKRFNYPLFKNLPYKKYKSFILRNSGSDNNNTHFRDIMMTSLVKKLNFDVQDYNSCVVFLNGKYWGIYHIREKINEHFLKQHYRVNKDSVAILKHRFDVQHYGRINYKNILKYLKKTKFKEQKNIDSLSKLIDIDNYLDYNIAEVYFNNIDAGGNIRYWRHRKKGSKWRWILFDTDFGFHLRKSDGYKGNSLKKFTRYNNQKWPTPPFSTLIIRKLLENDSVKNIYVQKMTYYLNTTFDSTTVLNRISEIKNNLKSEIPFHFKRWKTRKSKWEKQVKIVEKFAKERPYFMREHMKEKFNFDTTFLIQINHSKQGKVYFDSYKIDSGKWNVYFSQVKYKLVAKPKFGYDFLKWKEDLNSTNIIEEIILTKKSKFTAEFTLKPRSKFFGKIRINEVSTKDSIYSDYIELYNSSEKDIDISSWIIQKNNKKKFRIKQKTTLKKGEYYTIFKDTTKENKKIKNSEIGLFNLKKKTLIKLFSIKEELVDSLQLSKEILLESGHVEYEKNIINEGWTNSDLLSINKENTIQIKTINQLKYLVFGLITFFSLILILWIILRLRKRRNKN